MKQLFIIAITIFILNHLDAQIIGIKTIGDTCSSQTLSLQATGTSSSPYFFWNFGDPPSGTNDTITIEGGSLTPFPTHTFTSPGVYNVCVSFQEPGFPVSTICRSFSIGLCCNGIISSSDSCSQNNIPFFLTTAATINSITWNFGDPASAANNVSTSFEPTHRFSNTGSFIITATVTATCGTFTATVQKDITSCGTPVECTGTVLFDDSCENASFQILSNNTVNAVVWDFGDPSSDANNTSTSFEPVHIFSAVGNYVVSAIVSFDCGIDTLEQNITIGPCDTSSTNNCRLYIPAAFSPNNDRINDQFSAVNIAGCLLSEYELQVFNRWGELVFKSGNPNNKWNGKHKNKECPIGAYVYLVKYQFGNQTRQVRKGGLKLLRR